MLYCNAERQKKLEKAGGPGYKIIFQLQHVLIYIPWMIRVLLEPYWWTT